MTVLDASVIIKWFKPDEKSPAADRLLKEHLASRDSIFVPILLLYEFTNALLYSKRLTIKEIEIALGILEEAKINYVNPDRELLVSALLISAKAKISLYDSSYIALAQKLDCALITADQKLYQKAKSLIETNLL